MNAHAMFGQPRSLFRILVLGCCCAALVAGCSSEYPPDDPQETQAGFNLIIFVLDTFRADQLGVYGNPDGVTPNLDRLARRSIVFTRAYAQSSWTKTSVASLFTGLYPVKHQVYDEELRPRGFLPEHFLTLAELLQQCDYRTYAISGNPHVRSENGFGQGFDSFAVPRRDWEGNNSAEITELTLTALEEIGGEAGSFFLYVHYLDPHDPWVQDGDCAEIMGGLRTDDRDVRRGKGYVLSGEAAVVNAKEQKTRSPVPRALSPSDQDYIRRLYACEATRVDANVGRVLDRAEALGLLGNTIIVVTADHGEEFWEHGMLCHGYQLYEETVRVPLIVHSPFLDQPHAVLTDPVALIDIYPTIAGETHTGPGADQEYAADGAILPLFDGAGTGKPARVLYGETRFRNRKQAFAVADDLKLVIDLKAGEEWLFDLASDPAEARPLTIEDRAEALRLKKGLIELLETENRYDWRDAAEQPPSPDEETVKRLKSLGYVE
jgi:arylsulfatase A-like enzyme